MQLFQYLQIYKQIYDLRNVQIVHCIQLFNGNPSFCFRLYALERRKRKRRLNVCQDFRRRSTRWSTVEGSSKTFLWCKVRQWCHHLWMRSCRFGCGIWVFGLSLASRFLFFTHRGCLSLICTPARERTVLEGLGWMLIVLIIMHNTFSFIKKRKKKAPVSKQNIKMIWCS